jgi:hypothetical protein
MKKNANILQELLKEARGLKGMIAEVACKSRLLAGRVKSGGDPEVAESLTQMQSDLDKYSERLDEIFMELDAYAIVPKLE